MTAKGFAVSGAEAGKRLDAALERLVPDMGLRARQRLCARGLVLVDGRPRPKGFRLEPGQVVEVAAEVLAVRAEQLPDVPVVARQGDFLALLKPSGMHSASVAGGPEPGVDALLPDIAPGYVLVNRLDGPTSGLLLAGADSGAVARFRALEAEGKVEKTYFAVVQGSFETEILVRNALDTADRKRTRVLERFDPDPARHTLVSPVRPLPGRDAALVKAVIRRGARHQIRAHLAHLGHPVLGDPLYGSGPEGAKSIYLHHAAVRFPGFFAESHPDWDIS